LRIALLVTGAVLAAAAPAAAAETVTVPAPVDKRCAAPGPGVATARFVPTAGGLVTVTLRAAAGDWDLAVLDERTGFVHGASSWSGARERTIAAATRGWPLVALACRRRGGAARARVAFTLTPTGKADRSFPARVVRVPLDGAPALRRLEALGLDVTHNATPWYADVVIYSAAERVRLLAAGFHPETRIADLRATESGARAATPLPSGQAAYRTSAEYGEQLKKIVAEHPGLARTVTAGASIEGRPIEGVELASNVDATDDGRPALLLLGLHHAREWPSGEMPMEFALELARLYGTDPRITSLLDTVRVIAIPVANPDGFEISRSAGPMPGDDDSFSTLPLIVSDSAAYKRKNCRAAAGSETTPCATRPALQGVDINRNYGAYWGGVGSSTDPTAQDFRGAAPYSEPESEAIHHLSSTRMITTVVTHHTYTDSGVWLRQPGFCKTAGQCSADVDVVPDEAGMRALGDAMGAATGWRSALGWDIGEITGATEDWNYFTQGAYGYTPEQRGVNFHPNFDTAVVAEYPGVREALLRAGENAGAAAFHGLLEGSAPAGRILRLSKSFDTATSQPGVVVKDKLDFTLTVPAAGRYRWHVNPSTRPLATAPEAYALTCEGPDGTVLERRDVVVARGATVTADLACNGAGASGAPVPAVTARLVVKLGSLSAARLNRTRRFSVRVRAVGAAVTDVRARLVRGKKTIARGSLASLSAAARTLRLKRVATARPGALRLLVTGRAGGKLLSSATAVRLRR
jgi:hypothetical protein